MGKFLAILLPVILLVSESATTQVPSSSKFIPTMISDVPKLNTYPVKNANGDYHVGGGETYMPWVWKVVANGGVNKRCRDRLQSTSLDIPDFKVETVIQQGENFNGVSIVSDKAGNSWIWWGTSSSRYQCFIRANDKYVVPVRKIEGLL